MKNGDHRVASASSLFDERPDSWLYRGDRFLWCCIQDSFNNIAIPESEERFLELIQLSFLQITGFSLYFGDLRYVNKLDGDGLWRGMISCKFWRTIAIPKILSNYRKAAEIKKRESSLLYKIATFIGIQRKNIQE